MALLDDYGLCGPTQIAWIDAAFSAAKRDPSIGLLALGWWPARSRRRRDDGLMALAGCPLLLQAAIWRRDWFLELAEKMHPSSSAWGFESQGTQLLRSSGRRVCDPGIPEPRWAGGRLVDGFEKSGWPLPYHNLTHGGKLDERHRGFVLDEGFRPPSRGVGDSIDWLIHRIGLKRPIINVLRAIGIEDCGCGGRQETLNLWQPEWERRLAAMLRWSRLRR